MGLLGTNATMQPTLDMGAQAPGGEGKSVHKDTAHSCAKLQEWQDQDCSSPKEGGGLLGTQGEGKPVHKDNMQPFYSNPKATVLEQATPTPATTAPPGDPGLLSDGKAECPRRPPDSRYWFE